MEVRVCDAEDLARLRRSLPTPGDVAGSHYAEQHAGHAAFLVAWQGDEPLGWVMIHWAGCIGPNAKAAYPESATIMHLQVRPECRNQGAGSALIAAAEKAISNRNIAVATISVGLENSDAARLYDRCGYKRTGITDVSEYEWVDENQTSHHEREINELLIKRM